MRRFFAHPLPDEGLELQLAAAESRHVRVLRLAQGEQVELFDGQGGVAEAELVALDLEGVRCRILHRRAAAELAPASIHLLLGLPKGNKLDTIVRMLGEIGVASIHLCGCERSVPQWKETRAQEQKLERFRKIAQEAARQSEQPCVPEVFAPAPLREAARRAGPEAMKRVCLPPSALGSPESPAAEEEKSRSVLALSALGLWLAVGPEGGFSPKEVQGLQGMGFLPLHFDMGVLRVETAAVVAAAWGQFCLKGLFTPPHIANNRKIG